MFNAEHTSKEHTTYVFATKGWPQLSCLHHRKSAACTALHCHRKLHDEELSIPAEYNAPLTLCEHCQQATVTLQYHTFRVQMTTWHAHVRMTSCCKH